MKARPSKTTLAKARGRCQCRGQCDGHEGRCNVMDGQSRLFDSGVDLLEAWKPGLKSEKALCHKCIKTYVTSSQKKMQGKALTEASQRMIQSW